MINITYLKHKNCPPKIEKYIPPADTAFYLKIEPKMIMKRSRIPEQGIAYLERKKNLYDMCASIWNFKIIDASASQENVFSEILAEIK
jgi:thymidylate kinase